ncbi:hypothetical protein PMEGAS228_17550 [Priestia megaterium]
MLESIFPEGSVNKRPNALFLYYGVLEGLKKVRSNKVLSTNNKMTKKTLNKEIKVFY